MEWLSDLPYIIPEVVGTIRTICNPVYFGTGLAIVYVCAWFRMESLAGYKRQELNRKILQKKGTGLSVAKMSLSDYCDKYNGEMFMTNSFVDIINSMKSKGKIPLRMAENCQPVKLAPAPHVLWESNCVRVQSGPVLTDGKKAKVFEAIRPVANINVQDALQVLSVGGTGHWKDPRKLLFSKEHLVYIRFNFFDAVNFFAIFVDPHGLKRICSVSAEEFLDNKRFDVATKEIEFSDKTVLGRLRISEDVFFAALGLLVSHTTIHHP